MSLYELVNPSDGYYFEAPSRDVATAIVALIGDGAYGAREVGSDWKTPVMFGWPDWLETEGYDLEEIIDQKRAEVLAGLRSVLIGDVQTDRQAVFAMTEQQRAERHDKLRGSLNDIGSRAMKIADSLEKAVAS